MRGVEVLLAVANNRLAVMQAGAYGTGTRKAFIPVGSEVQACFAQLLVLVGIATKLNGYPAVVGEQ